MIVNNTPVEWTKIGGVNVLVKREDLCSPFPGPAFSKIRGLVPHLQKRDEEVVGILDTFHSKAGWAVSYVCKELGKKAVVFYPQYKSKWTLLTSGEAPQHGEAGTEDLRVQQRNARDLGAELVPLQATAGYILEPRAKKILRERWPGSHMLPVGLKMPESVAENAKEAVRTIPNLPRWPYENIRSLVISVSSGTVAAGVIKGLNGLGALPEAVVCHLGYSRPVEGARGLRKNLEKKSGVYMGAVTFIDEGYNYRDPVKDYDPHRYPFPTNPYYDGKALRWLEAYAKSLPQPILFWNIGA
jgi:hypothetical protein